MAALISRYAMSRAVARRHVLESVAARQPSFGAINETRNHFSSVAATTAKIVANRNIQFIHFVPERQAWIVERFGKFSKMLTPGLHVTVPIVDNVKFKMCLSVMSHVVEDQVGITRDNVEITMDGVLYWQIIDPGQAAYNVDDCQFAVMQMAKSTMRSELGKLTLEEVFQERARLNERIMDAINEVAEDWGIRCLRYEIRDINPPNSVLEAMELQVTAERKKRETIISSEAQRQAEINTASGEKQAVVLESEAQQQRIINLNKAEAEAILLKATAIANGIERLTEAINKPGGKEAAQLKIADRYLEEFGKLAKENNTILLPSNMSDPSSMIAQAMSVYKTVGTDKTPPPE